MRAHGQIEDRGPGRKRNKEIVDRRERKIFRRQIQGNRLKIRVTNGRRAESVVIL